MPRQEKKAGIEDSLGLSNVLLKIAVTASPFDSHWQHRVLTNAAREIVEGIPTLSTCLCCRGKPSKISFLVSGVTSDCFRSSYVDVGRSHTTQSMLALLARRQMLLLLTACLPGRSGDRVVGGCL